MTTFPAHFVRQCAHTAGSHSMLVRKSEHSFTGFVVVARFRQENAVAARGFARASASCIGIACAVRRYPGGWAVSVPCGIV